MDGLAILLAALGAGLLVAAARDVLASMPAAVAGLSRVLEPLRRAGREGYDPSEAERRRLMLLGSLSLPLGVAAIAGPGPAPLFALVGPAATGSLLARRRERYRRAVESALGAIAAAVADSLGAGRSVRVSLGEAGESLDGPAAAEMARLRSDLELGTPTRVALRRFCERVSSPRADAFVAALLTHERSGGDLPGLLRRFAAAARERERVVAEARAATAQARFTGMLVVGMPLGAGALAEVAHPGFVASTVAEPLSLILLGLAAGLQVAAFLAIRKLGAVEG